MPVDHHPLIREFPEHREKIHQLKTSNAHFLRLAEDYENLDKEIVRIEDGIEARSDHDLEDLKKRRLSLKDQLYTMLLAP